MLARPSTPQGSVSASRDKPFMTQLLDSLVQGRGLPPALGPGARSKDRVWSIGRAEYGTAPTTPFPVSCLVSFLGQPFKSGFHAFRLGQTPKSLVEASMLC